MNGRFAASWVAVGVIAGVFGMFAFVAYRQQGLTQAQVATRSDTIQHLQENPIQVPIQTECEVQAPRYITAAEVRKSAGQPPSQFLGSGSVPTWFLDLSLKQAQYLFHGTVREIPFKCSKIERYGKVRDGGYNICLEGSLHPKQNDCLVYSFGINNEWSFDEAVNTKLGCEVHSFDPSMHKGDHMHKQNMYFHNLGIWGSNMKNKQGWEMRDLQTIISMLNHTNRIIDYLKIDVEGAGWKVVETILRTGIHSQIKQIAFEMHAPRIVPAQLTLVDYGEIFNSLQSLKGVGYEKFDYRAVNFCCGRFTTLTPMDVAVSDHELAKYKRLCCYEVFYVNTRFIK